jgi:hypothetical protein
MGSHLRPVLFRTVTWYDREILFGQTFFKVDMYCIVQFNVPNTDQDPCKVAAHVLAACNNGGMSFPSCLSPSRRDHFS